jgi:hypothetical protein
MSLQATVARMTARNGARFTIRRETVAAGANAWTKGTATVTFLEVVARERFYRPDEIKGAIVEGDALITVTAPPCGFVPVKGDRIALGSHVADAGAEWRQITNVYAPRIGSAVAVYKLTVRQ